MSFYFQSCGGSRIARQFGDLFDFLWQDHEGFAFICVGVGPRMEDGKLQHCDFVPLAFQWPGGKKALVDAGMQKAPTCDVYVSVCAPSNVLWPTAP